MAAHYDFRLMLAVKLSRLLNVMVNPDEFTIGPRSDPTFPTTRESVITVNTTVSVIWPYLDAGRNLTLFRNLRFWYRALPGLELDAVLSNK